MKRILITILLTSLVGIGGLMAQERIFIPELSQPANGAIDQMPDVVLDWNAVTGGNTGIIHYQVQLDTDPDFPNPAGFETEFLSAVKTSELMFGETYYWRVRAIDGTDISGWSETWSFRVIRRVVLFRPNDASNQTTEVKLEWTAISGTTEYDYQIDTAYYWKTFPSGLTSNILAVGVVDENNAWIAGAGGKIQYYDGATMTAQNSGTTNDLLGISFVDASHGWAVGKGGKILHFDGIEWAEQNSGLTTDLLAVSFLDASHGWAVGNGGKILFYNGTEWTTQFTASKDLQAVFALDANHVWAAGKGGLILFYNGSSWSEQVSNTTRDLFGVSFFNEETGFIAGKSGLILQFTEDGWQTYTHSLTTRDLTGITFVDAETAWITGKNGTTLQFDGIEWFNQSGGTNTNLNAVGFSGQTGFLAGDNGTLVRYNDDAFSSPLATIHHVPGTTLSANLIDLFFGTQYFWRMRAKHTKDISGWSGARSFNTVAAAELDKPNDNSTAQQLNVQLKWKKTANLVSYEIEVDDDPDFGSPVYLATPDLQINARLLKFGQQYNWRVRALHAYDTSNWSPVWKFSTVSNPTLKTPANNETEVKLSPMLTWDPLTGITGYQVHFSDDSGFSNLMVNIITAAEENQFAVPVVLDKATMYYWKVRGINGLDTSNWSPAWSFTTMQPIGIGDPGIENNLSIYPNPADKTLFIQLKSNSGFNAQLTITDLVGKAAIAREVQLTPGNKVATIDVSGLKNGIYMLRLAQKDDVYTRKLIIKR